MYVNDKETVWRTTRTAKNGTSQYDDHEDIGLDCRYTLNTKMILTGSSFLHQHTPCRTLRSASANLLSITRCNLSFGTHGFRTAAPTIWNSLPANVRSCITLSTFRRHLKSHLSVQLPHCLATHLSASDSLRLWRYINLLTYYLLTLEVERIRQRGRPKKIWWECINNAM